MSFFKRRKTNFQRTIDKHRELLGNLLNNRAIPVKIDYTDIECPLKNKVSIPLRIYRPEKAYKNSSKFPTIFFIPGTAYVGKEMAYTHVICSMLAKLSKCQIVLITHRLAPEHKFPIPYNDVVDITKKLIKYADKFHIDKSKIIMLGYSSGANLAAAATIELGKMFSRVILISPIVDLSRTLKKYHKFEEQDGSLPKGFVNWFLNLYIPIGTDLKDPRISPFWGEEKLHHLPPTDIIFGEYDRFRSDAEAFTIKLMQKNVPTSSFMIDKNDHGCLWNNLRVVEAIATIAQHTLGTGSIPKSILDKHHPMNSEKPNPHASNNHLDHKKLHMR